MILRKTKVTRICLPYRSSSTNSLNFCCDFIEIQAWPDQSWDGYVDIIIIIIRYWCFKTPFRSLQRKTFSQTGWFTRKPDWSFSGNEGRERFDNFRVWSLYAKCYLKSKIGFADKLHPSKTNILEPQKNWWLEVSMCAFFQNWGSFFWRFKIPFFPNTSRSPFPKNPTSWDGKTLAVPSKLPQVLEPYERGIISIYPINTHVIFQMYMVLIIFWVHFALPTMKGPAYYSADRLREDAHPQHRSVPGAATTIKWCTPRLIHPTI